MDKDANLSASWVRISTEDKHTEFMSLDYLDEVTQEFINDFSGYNLNHDSALDSNQVEAIQNFTRWVKQNVRERIKRTQHNP